MWHVTRDIWHVAYDIWQCDMRHMTCDMLWGVNILSKFLLPSFSGLWFMIFWRFGGKGWRSDWRFGGKGSRSDWMSNKADCRTAPATPGLLTTSLNVCIFTESPDSVIKLWCSLVVCVCVTSRKIRFQMDWRPLGKERISNFGIPQNAFEFLLFQWFLGFWVFANQPIVHTWGVSRKNGCSCRCWRYWHFTHDTWHMYDTWHVTHDFSSFFLFVSVCFSIIGSIRTHWKIQCLPYEQFSFEINIFSFKTWTPL